MIQLQLDHFRFGSEGIDGRCAVFKVEYGHQLVIDGVHSAQRCCVFIHHRNACLPAQVFPDFSFYANPGALVHAADFDFLILLELMVYIFLIVGDKVQPAFKNADGAEGTDVRLIILAGGEMLDIVIDLINRKTGGGTKYINQRDKDFVFSSLQEDNYRTSFYLFYASELLQLCLSILKLEKRDALFRRLPDAGSVRLRRLTCSD